MRKARVTVGIRRDSTRTETVGRRITGISNTLLRYLIKTAPVSGTICQKRKQRRRQNDKDKRDREGTRGSVRRVE